MWIGICEDEFAYRTRFEKEVRSIIQPNDRVTVYANGFELLDDIHAATCTMDLLLLDIEMPALSGIETAREFQETSPDTQIVIITSHTDFALKCYEIRPSNYLVKPVPVERLALEIDRARRIAGETIGETLHINTKETSAFVPLKDILYLESHKETLEIHTIEKTFRYNHKISTMEDTLNDKGFCRIHKSILVNLRHVKSINRSEKNVLMVSGKLLPVSELRITDVLMDYSRFWQSFVPKNTAPLLDKDSLRLIKS